MQGKVEERNGEIVIVLDPEFARQTGFTPGLDIELSGVEGKVLAERITDAGINPNFESAWKRFYGRYKDALVELSK